VLRPDQAQRFVPSDMAMAARTGGRLARSVCATATNRAFQIRDRPNFRCRLLAEQITRRRSACAVHVLQHVQAHVEQLDVRVDRSAAAIAAGMRSPNCVMQHLRRGGRRPFSQST
jgi:hypothetical protein